MVELRKHQQEAVDAIMQSFEKCKTKPHPCLAQLATASGKSFLCAEIARLHQSALILAPTKEIVEQNYEKLLALGIPRKDIGICSASAGSHAVNRVTIGTIGTVKSFTDELKDVDVVIIDECLDGECEVLTPSGWAKISEMPEQIAQWENGRLSFVKPSRWVKKKPNDKVVKTVWGGRSGKGATIYMTQNHRQLAHDMQRWHSFRDIDRVFLAKDLQSRGSLQIYTAQKGELSGEPPYLDMLKIAICADGHIEKRKNGQTWVRLSFRRERKIKRAEWLLEKNNLPYKKTVNARGDTSLCFHLDCTKSLSQLEPTLDYSTNRYRALELMNWDGSHKRCLHRYYADSPENAKVAQTIGTLGGFTTRIKHYDKEPNIWYVSFIDSDHTTTNNLKTELVDYDDFVYCPTVSSSFFLVKKDGLIFVTGNCDVVPIERSDSEYMSFLQQLTTNKICGLTATTWRNQVFKRQFEDPRVYCRPLTRIPTDKGKDTRFGQWFWSGGMVYRCGVRELQELGYLSPVKYIVQKTDWSFLDRALGRVDYDEQQLGIWANIDGNREIFERALSWAAGQFERTLVFAPNIAASHSLCSIARRLGIAADTIDSQNDNRKSREAKLKRFREGKTQVLFNVAILTAGYDLPSLDCVLMCRATKSLRLYVQSIGRALRIDPDKPDKIAQVVDMAGNMERFGRVEDIIMTQVDAVASTGWKYKKDVIAYKPLGSEKYKILDRVS